MQNGDKIITMNLPFFIRKDLIQPQPSYLQFGVALSTFPLGLLGEGGGFVRLRCNAMLSC